MRRAPMSEAKARETVRILKTLDVDAALPGFRSLGFPQAYRDDGTPADERTTCLAGLHKARLMKPNVRLFNKAEKQRSRTWLRENGYEIPGGDA